MSFKHADKFPSAPRSIWRGVDEANWNDWRWQQQNRLTMLAHFEQILSPTPNEKLAFARCSEKFKVAVTPYYAALIDANDENCPIRRQSLPSLAELKTQDFEKSDPLTEDLHSPATGVVHRYPDRVLLYTTHNCPVYCRHCTRKRKVGNPSSMPDRNEENEAIDYIAKHSEIRDVILSGGDPLSLSNNRLANLLEKIYSIPHVEIIRIGTRNLVTLPQRIDDELVYLLKQFRPLYVLTHFNHPRECTAESLAACDKLLSAGVSILNQTVLLKGVNDDAAVIKRLNQLLLIMQVKPYYIYQCDEVEGVSHFRVSLRQSVEIMKNLQGWTSGLAVPHLAVDLNGGGGKVHIEPNVVDRGENFWTFENYEGNRFVYED